MVEKHGGPLAVGADMCGRHSDDRTQPGAAATDRFPAASGC